MTKFENQTWIIVTALSAVFVLGAVFGATHLQYAFAGMFGPNSSCGNGGELTHWDKFVFHPCRNLIYPVPRKIIFPYHRERDRKKEKRPTKLNLEFI